MQTDVKDMKETMTTKLNLKDLATKNEINMLAEKLHTEIQSVYVVN